MSKILTWTWWHAALVRAGRQAAQSMIAAIVVGGTINLLEADWTLAVGFAIGGALTSIVASITSLPEAAGKKIARWKAIAWRVFRTGVAALGGLIAAAGVEGFDALTFNWSQAVLAVAGTMALAFLTAAAERTGLPEEDTTGISPAA